MTGGKTVATATGNPGHYFINHFYIIAGPNALHRFFNEGTTREIRYPNRKNKTQHQKPALQTICRKEVVGQIKVKQQPYFLFPDNRHQKIKYRVAKVSIYELKQPLVKLQYAVEYLHLLILKR